MVHAAESAAPIPRSDRTSLRSVRQEILACKDAGLAARRKVDLVPGGARGRRSTGPARSRHAQRRSATGFPPVELKPAVSARGYPTPRAALARGARPSAFQKVSTTAIHARIVAALLPLIEEPKSSARPTRKSCL